MQTVAKSVKSCIVMYGRGMKTYITMYCLVSTKSVGLNEKVVQFA